MPGSDKKKTLLEIDNITGAIDRIQECRLTQGLPKGDN